MKWIVDTNVPYGNACEVAVRAGADGPEVSFTPDPHGGTQRLWFCFRLRAEGADAGPADVRLVWKFFDSCLGARDPAAARPIVRPAGGDWQRLEPGKAIRDGDDGPVHGLWTLPFAPPHVDVAWCYPYGPGELDALVAETGGYWTLRQIGVTQHGRAIPRLCNPVGEPGGRQPGLFFVCRQHAGETPGSWVLDGLLRALAEANERRAVIWALPLANLDGVLEGDYGKDPYPYDVNRAWGRTPARHETLAAQVDLARWWDRCRPILGIDFHAPGTCEQSGVYAYLPKPETSQTIHARSREWAEAVAAILRPRWAAKEFARVMGYVSLWETPNFGTYFASKDIPVMSVETPYSQIGSEVLTPDSYRQIGRAFAEVIRRRLDEEA